MRESVLAFASDVAFVKGWTPDQIFDYVEKIPYVGDWELVDESEEIVSRPARFSDLPGLDCKKKAIFIACWAQVNGYPWRFIAVDDTGKGISHVFADVKINGEWLTMDCTVEGLFRPGSPMPEVQHAEII